jgi:hypothetical protein
MRSKLENVCLALVPVVALLTLSSCKYWSGGGGTPPGANTPGSINSTLNMKLGGGGTSTKCTVPAVTWTASSPSGSPQTKSSPAITANDNVMSQCTTYDFEGTTYTSCYCQVSVAFTSLAPGTWTVQAAGATCPVKVNPGQISSAVLYDDGRGCTHIP